MPDCVYINGKKRKLCIGALRNKIKVYDRNIQEPVDGSVDFTENFTNETTKYAYIETTRGVDIFNGVELIGNASHLFYIRYDSSVTSQSWIEYNEKYFDILQAENIDERNEWLILRCRERGDKTKLANWS